jgi:biotin carboxyl carrier protein
MTYEVTIGDRVRQVHISSDGDALVVRVDDGPERRLDVARPEPHVISLLTGGRSYEAGMAEFEGGYEVSILGRAYPARVVDPRRAALKLGGAAAKGVITTSMPGRVVRVLVAPGDAVEQGQPLLVVEAMKMENEIDAPFAGRVVEIAVEAGQAVDAGARLLQIEPEAE